MKKALAQLAWLSLLSLSACDAVNHLWPGEVTGHVFIRTGSGDTKPQGGLEVRLLDPAVTADIEGLRAQFRDRIQQTQELLDQLMQERRVLQEEADRWTGDVRSKIEITISAARNTAMPEWADLYFTVKNESELVLESLSYRLFCGIDAIDSDDVNGLRNVLYLEDLGAGQEIKVEASVSDKNRVSLILRCSRLRANPTQFSGKDPKTGVHYDTGLLSTIIPVTGICPTEVARKQREKIESLKTRAHQLLTAGVTDLDTTLQSAIEKHTRYLTRTTVDGVYRFGGVTPGRYILSGWYASVVDDTGWFVTIEIPHVRETDLSNFNLSDPRFGYDWQQRVALWRLDMMVSGTD